jgi:transcriptional regulator with XRE-family HTH domain
MRSQSTFGQRLRHARREAGLSQSVLEARSGIPKARLSRYENGHVLPSIGTLGRLAAALGVSEASLLGDQRSLIDEFVNALMARGVVLQSAEQARKLAGAVADIYEALGLGLDEAAVPAPAPVMAAARMAEVTGADLVDGSEVVAAPSV